APRGSSSWPRRCPARPSPRRRAGPEGMRRTLGGTSVQSGSAGSVSEPRPSAGGAPSCLLRGRRGRVDPQRSPERQRFRRSGVRSPTLFDGHQLRVTLSALPARLLWRTLAPCRRVRRHGGSRDGGSFASPWVIDFRVLVSWDLVFWVVGS